ncbi:hypothetical protein KSP39_PZI018089 [Platanthera zijinensis]|uniref:Translation initiation factor eIF2B subunit gamma n=1 Tax=Platanthera zijinensis TaxID=2320716 RepID=A0AAP0B406_9ASPA
MTSVVSKLTWLESLLGDMRVKLSLPATLLCDSQAAVMNMRVKLSFVNVYLRNFIHFYVQMDDIYVVVCTKKKMLTLSSYVSREIPKPLLPVANRPVLSYVLELLEANNLKDLIVVVKGKDAALQVGGWISGAYVDRLHVEVAAVPEETGTADALRAVAHHLTAKDILIVSGDLVSDVSPGVVAATHRRLGAVVTALFCNTPVSGPSDTGSSVKDKGRKPPRVNIVGLDQTRQYLLHVAAGAEVDKDIKIQKSLLRHKGQMEIRADLMDAHMYAIQRKILQEVLDKKEMFHSIKHDVFPYLVRTQLKSEVLDHGEPRNGLNGEAYMSQILTGMIGGFSCIFCLNNNFMNSGSWSCVSHIISSIEYGVRLRPIKSANKIHRNVVEERNPLQYPPCTACKVILHPKEKLFMMVQVGPHCMLDGGSKLGDKCSVKRSVIGRHCRIGSNVKIVNSVVMNHVTIEDGCFIQGSVICNNVQIQERVVLKDCQVGEGYILTSGSEYKSESLSKR